MAKRYWQHTSGVGWNAKLQNIMDNVFPVLWMGLQI